MHIVKRLVKQRKDSIEQFAKGGREDLVGQKKPSSPFWREFLPKSLPREEILKIAEAKKAEIERNRKSNSACSSELS